MQNKIIVRLNAVVFLFLITFLSANLYYTWKHYLAINKEYVHDYGGSYDVCVPYSRCTVYEKRIIESNEISSLNNFEKEKRNSYYNDIEFINSYINSSRNNFYINIFLVLGQLMLAAYYWLKSLKFELNDKIVIRNFLFTKYLDLNLIDGINILTETPLISERTSIDQINWRDKAEIVFTYNGMRDSFSVSLFYYPNFKKIIKAVCERRPDLKVTFSKKSVLDVIQDAF